jgi:hypothetical protein
MTAPKGQIDRLLALCVSEGVVLFHDQHGTAHARCGGLRFGNAETDACPVRSEHFKIWLTWTFYKKTGKVANSESSNAALRVLEGKAFLGASEVLPEQRWRKRGSRQ